MKKLLSVALTMSFLVACGPANEDYAQRLKNAENSKDKTATQSAEDTTTTATGDQKQPASQDNTEAVAATEYVGLGKVIIEGIAVARQGSQFVLDHRISTKNKVELSDTTTSGKNDAAKASKKFLNLGCTDLTAADTADLEEISAPTEPSKDIVMISAAKIFICGKQNLPMALATITSDELVLKNAEISTFGAMVNIIFTTNALSLQGENTILGRGLTDAQQQVPPTLQLIVHEQLSGSGTLVLKTIDGEVSKNTDASTNLPDTLETK